MAEVRIGPANYAGQAYEWAVATREIASLRAQSFAYSSRLSPIGPRPVFTFPVDSEWPHPRLTTPWGRRWRRRHLARATHVLLDGFVPVGSRVGKALDSDVDWLRRHNVQVGLISHGSDLRHPREHQHWNMCSYFQHVDAGWLELVQAQVEKNQRTLQAFPDIQVFVSTPDMLMHQPNAKWLPLVLSQQVLEAATTRRFQGKRPTFLHIPSRRSPPIKGTQFIDPVLTAMHARGVINYVSPRGVQHSEMLRLMRQADVVVDQLMAGWYGLTAVEAMASGAVVVAGISKCVSALVPEEPPVVTATPESFEEDIVRILDEREEHVDMAYAAKDFARSWHDGQRSAAVIEEWVKASDPSRSVISS